jgi:hypothetical protein
MPTARFFASFVLAAAALSTSGCLWAPGLAPLYRDLGPAHTAGAKDHHFEIRLGRLSMALAHALADDEEDEDADELATILQHVDGVEISVTEFEEGAAEVDGLRFERDVERLAQRYGWFVGASVIEPDSAAVVLYQGRRGTIQNVYLAVRESDSLVLARFRGNLDREFFEVLARQGDDVKEMAADEAAEEAPATP